MSKNLDSSIDFNKPILLKPDNFTPLSRTPWAGEAIARSYKQRLVPDAAGRKIGESWEFSCDPAFPSLLATAAFSLPELIKNYPKQILGDQGRTCEILVKLLNAGDPLSVQVHPRDDDPDLKPNECGKPESWYVLNAEPGAGLYLGFSKAVSRDELRAALVDGERGRALLQFVPVRPGDYFEIEPGVPHCIAPGVTLLEPQRIVEGLSGKTYRLWDFGRLYDKDGRIDMQNGKPRELHLDAGLKLVDPMIQTGGAWVSTLRRTPQRLTLGENVLARVFPANKWYRTVIVDAPRGGAFKLPFSGGYSALTVLSGSAEVNRVSIPAGQSALIPAEAAPLSVQTSEFTSFALVFPSYCKFGD